MLNTIFSDIKLICKTIKRQGKTVKITELSILGNLYRILPFKLSFSSTLVVLQHYCLDGSTEFC